MKAAHTLPSLTRSLAVLLISLLLNTVADARPSEAALWAAIRSGGHVVLMRHALAPGGGDPSNWTLADCASQRNLSAAGIRQAERSGALFRANGIDTLPVYSSRWCRAWDTAVAMDLGPVRSHPGLDSFFQRPQAREGILSALRELLRDLADGPSVLMVSHQVTIRGISGVGLESGGLLVARIEADGSLTPIGRLPTASSE